MKWLGLNLHCFAVFINLNNMNESFPWVLSLLLTSWGLAPRKNSNKASWTILLSNWSNLATVTKGDGTLDRSIGSLVVFSHQSSSIHGLPLQSLEFCFVGARSGHIWMRVQSRKSFSWYMVTMVATCQSHGRCTLKQSLFSRLFDPK